MSNELTDEEYQSVLMDDELYFETCLMIRTKNNGLVPLSLNSSQRYAHDRIEEQLARTGRVRVLILKGRQQGISTYVGARYYKKTSTAAGVLAYIVTHEDAATQNLFRMTKRYHDNNLPDFTPSTGISNANELYFDVLDSGYKIATAGARTAGRSSTIQLAHLSEFDFWPEASADDVFTGLMEAVPKADGTEVIIESTADKPGGRFHRAWQAAKRGETDFEAIFIPWFVHEEYRAEPPSGWEMPAAFEEYMHLHGLDVGQVYWAWSKNRDMSLTFGGSPDEFITTFKREYPATDEEAFEQAGDDLSRVIPLAWVRAAQARWLANRSATKGPMDAIGLDVAQGGPDNTCVAPWHGARLEPLTLIRGVDATDGPAVAGAVVSLMRDDAVIAVDMGGAWGSSALTHLKTHLKLTALGVNPAQGATKRSACGKYGFVNMRAQLHWQFREALDPVTGENLELPPDDDLVEELIAPTFEIKPRGIQIESKEEIKKRLGRSPDRSDATLLGYYATKRGVRALAKSANSRMRAERGKRPTVNRQYANAAR